MRGTIEGTPSKRFTLVNLLAVGGMGEVFLARQEGPAGFVKDVVLKRMLGGFASDRDFIQMFLDEARIAARLSHPNIVQVFELGANSDAYYITMEFVDGQSLQVVARVLSRQERRLPPELAIHVCRQALRGLHYAHELEDDEGRPLRIIHRDVTPENILVGFSGTVKLVDFGIAKAAVNHSITQSGCIKGKLHYLAPEQLRGGQASIQSDLYSMGVTLYQVLTGRRPFQGSNLAELRTSILTSRPTPPSQLNPLIPSALNDLILRALERQPERRHASAAQMADELDAISDELGTRVGEAQLSAFMRALFQRRTSSEEMLLPEGPSMVGYKAPDSKATATRPPPLPKKKTAAAAAAPPSPPSPPTAEPETPPPRRGGVRALLGRMKKYLGSEKSPPALGAANIDTEPEVEVVPPPEPSAPALPSESIEISMSMDVSGSAELSEPSLRPLLGMLHSNRVLSLPRSPLTLGQAAGNDIVVSHPAMPPRGCRLVRHPDGRWEVEALSEEGLWVNSRPLTRALLDFGDVLRVGGVEFLFFHSGTAAAMGEIVPEEEVEEPEEPTICSIDETPFDIEASPPVTAVPLPKPSTRPLLQSTEGMVRIEGRTLDSAYGGTYAVDGFWLDRCPVTNAEYLAFVEATGEPPPLRWLGGRPPARELDHPVVGVSLDVARRYAAWRGKRLPTQLEWEVAARGPQGTNFPWGDEFDPSCCHGPEAGRTSTSPVGGLPKGATPQGCLDMVGNVWEWTEVDASVEPAPEDGYAWVFGGSYSHLCCDGERISRRSVAMHKDYLYLGFRCARG